MNRIKELLKNPNNFVIINVTHDYLYTLKKKSDEDSEYFMPYEIESRLFLKQTHIENIFKKLEEIVKIISNKIIIIVFEEYFFSKDFPMKEEEFENISKICEKFTFTYQNTILFVNLLHTITILENVSNIKENILTYSHNISSRIKSNTLFWNVSSNYDLLEKQSEVFVRNCTYIYILGKEFYSHKKSTYCNEYSNKINYDIGFFEKDEINKSLLTEEVNLAKLIIDTFELHICLDFTYNFII